MPELPEVQTVVNTLEPHLPESRILRIVHLRADMVSPLGTDLPAKLKGRRFLSIHRRAKRIVFTLDDGNAFYIHLGMTGRLTLSRADAAIPLHTHLILDLAPASAGNQLRFTDPRRFGGIFWLGCESCETNIGPEPLKITTAQLAKCLSRTKRAVKNALLDQRLIAGLGNIYVDESLHVAGIHPLVRANKLKPAQIEALARSIKKVLRKAIKHRGSTLRDYVDAQGGKGAFQKLHMVYGREGEPCRKCETPIKRIVLGGRSTCFCPNCQKRRSPPT